VLLYISNFTAPVWYCICFTEGVYYICMKRKIGTVVLFVLLVLTVVALQQIYAPAATTLGSTGVERATN
jgi:hypothetical protein